MSNSRREIPPSAVAIVMAALIGAFAILATPFMARLSSRLSSPIDLPRELDKITAYDIIKSLRFCAVVVNKDNKVVFANESARTLFNIRADEIPRSKLELSDIFNSKRSQAGFSPEKVKEILRILSTKPRHGFCYIKNGNEHWRWDISAIETADETTAYLVTGLQFNIP